MLDRRRLAAIKPAPTGKTLTMRDEAVGGLHVRWGSTNPPRPAWVLVYRSGGQQIRRKLGYAWSGNKETAPSSEWLTIDEAREQALRIKAGREVVSVVFPVRAAPPSPAFGDVVDQYLDEAAPKRWREIRRLIHYDCGDLLKRPIARLTYHDTQPIISAVQRRAPITARNLFVHLQAIFNWSIRQKLMTEMPLIGNPPAKATARERVLTDDELRRIWHATEHRPAPLRAIVRCLILLGQRRQEVAEMRWTQIDKSHVWTIPGREYKTGATHTLPLDSVWRDILARLPWTDGNWVFSLDGMRPADMSRERQKLTKLSGVADWSLHDLRRTARTNWSKLRIAPEIRERLIHPATGITGVYDRHDFLDEKREALAKWAAYVAGLLAPAPSDCVGGKP
jgi:integrase